MIRALTVPVLLVTIFNIYIHNWNFVNLLHIEYVTLSFH